MTTLIQRSFSSGEISPSLYARTDLTKYASGLRTCRNSIVLRYGGVSNRPGSVFVGEVSDSSKKVRLVPFVFSNDQTYILEFGEGYIRVIKDGYHITDSGQNITAITNADPVVATVAGHGYSNGDEIYVNSVGGMTELNNRNFKVQNVTTDTFELFLMDSVTGLDGTLYGAYTSSGNAFLVMEISTDYTESEVGELNYIQSADVLTIAHQNHAPKELLRTSDTSWAVQDVDFTPDVAFPTSISSTAGAGGSEVYRYKVTAIDSESFEESLAGISSPPMVITAITNANPPVVTSTAHGLGDNDEIYIDSVSTMVEVGGNNYFVDNVTADTFELYGVDSTDYGVYVSGAVASRIFAEITSATPTTGAPNIISWTREATVSEYNIYKELNGVYGLIGVASGTEFSDIGITPNTTSTPPTSRNPFIGDNNYPATVTYIQQRLGFADTINNPEKIFLSKTGNFKNFTTSSPLRDDDAISFTMAGRQINEVMAMVDLGRLVIMTSGGEWTAAGDAAGVIKPTDINTKQYSYNGSGNLQPIIIDGVALYQQARGSIIRDLGYNFEVDGYTGNDLTIFSAHLFDKYTIVDWAYQQIPHSILWTVRSDGKLLGMTFVRNQEVMAWHIHDFDGGFVENVAVIPTGNEDFLYLTIKRTVDGVTKRYIEKFSTRQITDVKDSVFMDSSMSYDGRNTSADTMTLSGGTTWVFDELITLTSSASFFSAGDVGNSIVLNVGSDVLRCSINSYTSDTEVKIFPHKTIPVEMQAVSITDWSRAVDEITGLWHLEGKDVSIFADGFVVSSPYNPSHNTITVENGSITLDKPYSVITIGLPFISDIETLNIDNPNGETLSDKKKIVGTVNLFVEDSRGIWAGPAEPTGDDATEGLVEFKLRKEEGMDDPTSLTTDSISVNIRPEWNSNGRVFIRQIDPIPLTVLSVSPAGKFLM